MHDIPFQKPHHVVAWQDRENTGAIGWIVIHNVIDEVSGGGLFMHENASLQETQDLAYTMSLKNTLQKPMFGGGKGGIKFNPSHPDAQKVLRRFLEDNLGIIKTTWCTGGDLNTTTHDISKMLREVSSLKSPFYCLANMLEKKGFKTCLDQFNGILRLPENDFFLIDELITGYSIFQTIEWQSPVKPQKIIIQGFGKVGKAVSFYAQHKHSIVGICEKDWAISHPAEIPVSHLLTPKKNLNSLPGCNLIQRKTTESPENFLIRFLSQTSADLFCPCANRYTITKEVLETLVHHTFANSSAPHIIAGANNIFLQEQLINACFKKTITVIPEWISNSGSAIFFMEALKYQGAYCDWQAHIKKEVRNRIYEFISEAKILAATHQDNLYKACGALASIKMR